MTQTRSKPTKKAGTGKGRTRKAASGKAATKSAATRRATKKRPTRKAKEVAKPVTAQAAPVTDDERYRMIAERAYRNALQRRFRGGSPREDWLAAESEVDALLTTSAED